MNSGDLIKLLRVRHRDDIFATEVPEGSKHRDGGSGRGYLDAWAAKKSWSQNMTFGYEIKVTRRDFMQDEKWHNYRGCCDQFYFVCPWGLIDPQETGEGVGVLWATKTGTQLRMKRKAETKEADPVRLFNVYKSLLMRAHGGMSEASIPNVEYWREWLSTKEDSREIGHRVSRALQKKYSDEVTRVERENMRLKKQNEQLDEVKEILADLGVSAGGYDPRNEIKRAMALIPRHMILDLRQTADNLEKFTEKMTRKLTPEAQPPTSSSGASPEDISRRGAG